MYRGLDVGSGKVGAEERAQVTHHMLSALDPRSKDAASGAGYDASAYYDDAVRTIDDIHRRGRDAVVVGGAGMYLKWLTDGKPSAPGSTRETREEAERAVSEARARGGWREAVALLTRAGDAETGKTLSENDWYRLTRAYEIVCTSGQGVKSFARERPEAHYDFRCFFLSSPRVELYRRIDARVEGMFVDGIMDEAAWLLDAGIAPGENIPARSIGYRQAMEYLAKARAREIKVDKASLFELVHEIQALNRAYAKRQFTWFRGESRYAWIDTTDGRDAIARRILSEFDRDEHRAGGEEIGDLSKEELNLLKRYRPELTVLSDKSAVKRVLDSISVLV
jgi:tRNA dimethylallyltransferase